MQAPRTRHDLRCFCARQSRLATYGLDSKGRVYLHVRVWKQNKIYGEIVSYGEIDIRCRDCGTWHKIHIYQDDNRAGLVNTDVPEIGPRGKIS